MYNTFSRLPPCAIIAHRGSCMHAPENTIASFKKAITQKADAIEFDVCLSKDEQAVVIHGPDVDRTTNGHGLVNELTVNELNLLDAGSHFDPIYSQQKIPILKEVFEEYGRKIIFNIELKYFNRPYRKLPEVVSSLVNDYGLADWIFFSSFNPIILYQIHRLLPETPAVLLCLKGKKGIIARHYLPCLLRFNGIHPNFADVTTQYINWTHKNGWRIHAYTTNSPEKIEELISIGIDGVITDDPITARKIRDKSLFIPSN